MAHGVGPPADRPAFVRTGSSTREPGLREVREHVARQFANRPSGVLSA